MQGHLQGPLLQEVPRGREASRETTCNEGGEIGGLKVRRRFIFSFHFFDRLPEINIPAILPIQLLEYPIPARAAASQKPTPGDISGTRKAIIDTLVSKRNF